MALITTKHAILLTFHDIITYHKRTYCWPTRSKIQELISKKTGKLLSLSWIDDCLGWLKQNKYIVSYRNYGRHSDGTVYAKASNRQLTRKALTALIKSGKTVPTYLWQMAKQVFTPPDPPTATREDPPKTQDKVPPQQGKDTFLDPGHRRRLGLPDAPPFDPEKE